jgi:hypothetical protein
MGTVGVISDRVQRIPRADLGRVLLGILLIQDPKRAEEIIVEAMGADAIDPTCIKDLGSVFRECGEGPGRHILKMLLNKAELAKGLDTAQGEQAALEATGYTDLTVLNFNPKIREVFRELCNYAPEMRESILRAVRVAWEPLIPEWY